MNLQMKYINLMHILVQGLLLVYIGFKKTETPKFIYIIIGVLALLIPFSMHRPNISINYWNIVNIIHYLFIMPAFLYLSYEGYYNNASNISPEMFNNIFITGIIIMIYHIYKLYTRLNFSK